MFELIAAVHTPLDDGGALRLEVLPRLAAHLRAGGVDGVLVAGTTGEGPSLTGAERRRLSKAWVEAAGGLRVIVHVGHQSPREARDLARHAADVGAGAVCAAPPSWFAIGSIEALVETCAEIASGAPELPFLYYHVPSLSGVRLPMARLLEMARDRVPSFAGLKYTHLDPVDFQACVREHGSAMQLLWGFDELLVAGLALGAGGAAGSTYGFAAPLYRRLIRAHDAGDREAVRTLQSRSALLVETLAGYGYAAAAKTAMKLVGVDCGPVRLPLARLDGAGEKALRADLERIGFFDWVGDPP